MAPGVILEICPNSRKPDIGLHEKTRLLYEKFATRSVVRENVRNKSDGSSHVEASMFTPEAIS